MRERLLSILFLMLISYATSAEVKDWPAEARDYLKKIPQQTLTLEYVVGAAIRSADVFQLHQTELLGAEAVYESVRAVEDLKMSASYTYIDNRNEPLLPQFQPNSTKGWEAKAGLQQFLPTGTALSLEAVHTPKDIGFLVGTPFEAIESRVNLGLSQNLLGDFFGSSYRASKRSARYQQDALRAGVVAKVESSSLDVMNLFYQAWLKKEVTENLLEGKRRKEKLLKILRSQLRRGVVENSDVLQVEGHALSAEVDYVSNKRDLQSIWDKLVMDLKLPRSFLQVEALEIPMQLDSPEKKSQELCENMKYSDLEKTSYQILAAEKMVESAQEKFYAQKQKLMPDLKLVANYSANSFENNLTGAPADASKTFREVGNLDNPALSAGLAVSFPLQNRAQKAQYMNAKMEYEQAKLKRSMLTSDLETKWKLSCKTLLQKIEARDLYKQISEKYKKRVELDNRRFEVGRIKAFQWVQTEEEEAAANLRYKTAEVDVRTTAWDIQRQTGHLLDQMKTYMSFNAENIHE